MYNRVTKSTISLELTRRVNTDNTPYYAILYLLADRNKILIENPDKGTCRQIGLTEANKYLKLNKIKTEWFQNIDGSYLRIVDNNVDHILPITRELQLVNVKFNYKLSNHRDFNRIRHVKEKNFKLVRRRSSTGDTTETVTIDAFLPVWPMWVRVRREINDPEASYKLRTVYMKYEDQFYRFPYGNVSGNDQVCTGAANNGIFKTAEELWINWFTTQFNRDYKLNLKANKFHFKLSLNGRSGSEDIAIEPTFDLNEISLKLYTKSYKNLSLIDMFYYLTNVEEFDNLEMDKLFIKLPQKPWEPKKI